MSDKKYRPEPWPKPLPAKYSSLFNMYYCVIPNEKGEIDQKIFGKTAEEAEANANRIVACVNILFGISNEELEAGAGFWGRAASRQSTKIKELIAENAELIEILEYYAIVNDRTKIALEKFKKQP